MIIKWIWFGFSRPANMVHSFILTIDYYSLGRPANGRYPGINSGTFSKCAEEKGELQFSKDESVCGDGLVQGDEECDCPGNDCEGKDPCKRVSDLHK